MENKHVTCLEIDLNAIDFNLNYLKSFLNDTTAFMAVVKAFGYGTDAVAIAQHLTDKVAYFAVAYLDEGIALRNAGLTTPILVLHPQLPNLCHFKTYNLEPNIYSINLLKEWHRLTSDSATPFPAIHLKFNTGLNRLGFRQEHIHEICDLLKSNQTLKVASVFSHIAASEDPKERSFTLQQIDQFQLNYDQLVGTLGYRPKKHMLNTSGIINYASIAQFDMVRSGIGLYGFGNQKEITAQLKSVVQLHSVISQIHEVRKGDSVGYNRAFFTDKKTRIATIPIGHADGISRNFGEGIGYAFINNKKAFYVGNVCMDMLMVDVTDIACAEGDKVLIYRDQEHIEDMAKSVGTIPYELLTAISQRVRKFFKAS